MSKPLYMFAPSANVIKGPHAPDLPIIIQSTNVVFSDEIPKQFVRLGIKDFINYFKSRPLRYAFCKYVSSIIHVLLTHMIKP